MRQPFQLFHRLSDIAVNFRPLLRLRLFALTACLLSRTLLCDSLFALADINSLSDKTNNLIFKINKFLLMENPVYYK